jgi:hypothetical protein
MSTIAEFEYFHRFAGLRRILESLVILSLTAVLDQKRTTARYGSLLI